MQQALRQLACTTTVGLEPPRPTSASSSSSTSMAARKHCASESRADLHEEHKVETVETNIWALCSQCVTRGAWWLPAKRAWHEITQRLPGPAELKPSPGGVAADHDGPGLVRRHHLQRPRVQRAALPAKD